MALRSAGISEGVPLLRPTAGLVLAITDGWMMDIFVDLPPVVLVTFVPGRFLRLALHNTAKKGTHYGDHLPIEGFKFPSLSKCSRTI